MRIRNKLLISLVIVSVLLIVLISFTSQGRTRPGIVEELFGRMITPVQGAFYSSGEFFRNTFKNLYDLRNLKAENDALKEEVEKLKQQNRQLIQMALENSRLRNLLDFKDTNLQFKYIGASVTGRDPGNWYDVYTINKGSKDGVEVNDAVIVSYGYLVGKVIEAGDSYSKVMAIIDERSSVSIIVNRTRDMGIVSGNPDSDVIAIMELEADIVKGDDIITSEYSTLPKGLYIGKVKSVEKQERKLQKTVVIEPSVDFKRLEEVFVIKPIE
ncbi:MAG TPA: rod shape-determining protein MreC [Bacillota bacterium]|nr:rod shape-determining protein MreC [Bacillota bacterium]HPL53637.1 rod shape-determining protein MreC [Bacillota bacterium]